MPDPRRREDLFRHRLVMVEAVCRTPAGLGPGPVRRTALALRLRDRSRRALRQPRNSRRWRRLRSRLQRCVALPDALRGQAIRPHLAAARRGRRSPRPPCRHRRRVAKRHQHRPAPPLINSPLKRCRIRAVRLADIRDSGRHQLLALFLRSRHELRSPHPSGLHRLLRRRAGRRRSTKIADEGNLPAQHLQRFALRGPPTPTPP